MLTLFQNLQLILLMTGLTGLGSAQSANVLVVYPPSPAAQTQVTCQIAVDFFDANSNPVLTANFALTPGQSRNVTLTRVNLGAKRSFPLHPFFWAFAGVTSCGSSDPTCTMNDDCEGLEISAYDTDQFGNTVLRLGAAAETSAFGSSPD